MKSFLDQHALAIPTREFSKNPSKALRNASEQPVMVTKYGHPVACLVSIDYWNDLLQEQREFALERQINGEPGVPGEESAPQSASISG